MLAIKGIYAALWRPAAQPRHRLQHRCDRAAAADLRRSGSARRARSPRHFALNPHPTLIPAIEAGWVEQIHSFGSEVGMEDYIRARPDVFFTGLGRLAALQPRLSRRSPASMPATCSSARPCRSTSRAIRSTVTTSRIAGFGGAPNMGSDARGRRHPSEPWLKAGAEADPDGPAPLRRGRKLVVQIGETFGEEQRAAVRREAGRARTRREAECSLWRR